MSFTDDDLKRLKDDVAKGGWSPKMPALLARLEAAETDRDILHKAALALIESDMVEDIDMDTFISVIEDYEKRHFPIGRKAAGKS